MKRHENKHLTILFIPHSEKNPLTLKISYFAIKFFLSLLVLTIIVAAVSLSLTKYYAAQKARLDREKRTLLSERDTLYRILDQVEDMKKDLLILEQLKAKLRSKLYADSEMDVNLLDLLPALGGNSNSLQSPDLRQVCDELSFIKSELPAAFDLAREAISEAESLEFSLAHIPSINPTFGEVTSGFGYRKDPFLPTIRFHNGVDIPNSPGTLIWASADGVVNYAGTMSGYGNIVRIQHNCSLETIYAHLDSFTVRVGDRVSRRQVIGYMGSTGRSTDPHLHYEVRIYDNPVDPKNYIKDQER
ncbi:M23 family metallopeptidase [candidate division WOR-3 bacterium]|nr:M23 family metallopeptidase [candidate division WOR-3 bacterium]